MTFRNADRPARGFVARALAFTLACLATVATLVAVSPQADAADADNFDPGYIIDDELFFTSGDMTVQDIQDFLNEVGPSNCDNCLRKYVASTYDRPSETGRCPHALVGKDNISAAQMIYDVAQACEISPKVMLVMLQKEQSLLTLSAPSSSRYSRAMGYGCPDTAPCDESYFGLFIQLYAAARQLNWYSNPSGSFTWYPVGKTSYIRYHPKSSCGSSKVKIQNRATAALYYYTPYQPNAAALANLYGTGNSCSSYGNRNFWHMYTDWFGDPTGRTFETLSPTPAATFGADPSPTVTTDATATFSPSPEATSTPTTTTEAPADEDEEKDTPAAPTYLTHTVIKGDTVWGIALKYGSTVKAIIDRNDLSSSAIIHAGQKLSIPVAGSSSSSSGSSGGGSTPTPTPTETTSDADSDTATNTTYKVVAGDTLSRIASTFKVTVSAIVEANSIKNPNLIRVGQRLTIPVSGTSGSSGSSGSSGGGSTASSDSSSGSFVTHRVVAGDTVSEIAQKYGSTVAKIADANNLKNAALIYVGQSLKVPTS